MAKKNMIIAVVLSFIICGAGNLYNDLHERSIVEFIVWVIIGAAARFLTGTISLVFYAIGLIWFIYVLYDTYQCTNARNNDTPIPLLLNKFELK